MGKKPLLNTAGHSLSFQELETHWYQVLEKEGFDEQEDTARGDRPLKRWSGISAVYVDKFQPAGKGLISSFPESVYKEQERFLNHPEFGRLCVDLSSHGNSKLTPEKVRLIWADYCEGKTLRESEIKYGISDNRIHVVICKITEWMNLMDTRLEQTEDTDSLTIITRPFNPNTDNPIIYSSWRNALWYDEKRDERLAAEFYSLATKKIKELLRKPQTSIRIACAKENPDFIAGYAVMTGNHLEWVYVKIEYRKKGIARLLTRGFTSVSEPGTKIGKRVAKRLNLAVKEHHEVIQ